MCKPNLLYSPTAPKVHVFSDRTPDLPFPGPLPPPSTLPLQQRILHRTTLPAYDATYAGRSPAQRKYTRIHISCLLENSIHVYEKMFYVINLVHPPTLKIRTQATNGSDDEYFGGNPGGARGI